MKILAMSLALIIAGAACADNAGSPLNRVMTVHFEEQAEATPSKPSLKSTIIETYRLVLFFSNQCPHCVNFAPVLKHYADAHQWRIEAISLNGESLPEFPHAVFATQAMIDVAYQGKPVTYPALFIANTQTHALYPVSFGELGDVELKERMNTLLRHIKDYEGNH